MIHKVTFVLLVLALVETAKGLKCRVETNEKIQGDIQDVVRACMNMKDEGKDRNRNEWQQRRKQNQETQWNSNDRNSRDNDDQEQTYRHYQQTNKNNNRNQNENRQHQNGNRPFGNQNGDRSTGNQNRYRPFGYQNENRQFGNQNENRPYDNQNENRPLSDRNFFNHRNNQTQQNNNQKSSSPLEEIDPCIVHCIFRQMKMLGENSQPEKSSVISVMTQQIRDPELKEFIEQSVTECFEETETEDPEDSNCNMSKSFALCLEKKGEQNCEDWNEDASKNNQNKYNGTNSMMNNRRNG